MRSLIAPAGCAVVWQIGGFMSEIADEFKVVVVEAIKALCLKFPQVCGRCPL